MNYGRELPGYPYDLKAKLTRCIIWGQRKVFGGLLSRFSGSAPLPIDFRGEQASQAIYDLLISDKPCLVARFGWGEMETTLRGLDISDSRNHVLKSLFRFLVGATGPFWWDNSVRAGIVWACGYFPETDEALMRFSQRVCVDAGQIDLLASYAVGEKRLSRRFFPNVKTFPLGDYEPFWYSNPWTAALEGKKVLVVGSFPKTVEMQYKKRRDIFANPKMLPDFDLITYRSISSFAGNKVPYATWFEALQKMCDDIAKIDFDIAFVGCGSYGMSLGAFIKRDLGKKALHTGGITQLFFGIKGRRWDAISKYPQTLYNDAWTRPLPEDSVQGAKTIEGGCYW